MSDLRFAANNRLPALLRPIIDRCIPSFMLRGPLLPLVTTCQLFVWSTPSRALVCILRDPCGSLASVVAGHVPRRSSSALCLRGPIMASHSFGPLSAPRALIDAVDASCRGPCTPVPSRIVGYPDAMTSGPSSSLLKSARWQRRGSSITRGHATWLILPGVIYLSQRLSYPCTSMN